MAGKKNNIKKTEQPDKFGNVLQWAVKGATSVLILYFAYLVAARVADAMMTSIRQQSVPEQKRLMIRQLSEIVFYAVIVVGVLVALLNLGVQTASIVTFLGTLMVTIGLALQNTLSNIFSGVSVAVMDNFRIGDKVRVYLPWVLDPIIGRVENLNIAYVMLRQEQTGKIIYIPNSSVASNVVINMSRTAVVST